MRDDDKTTSTIIPAAPGWELGVRVLEKSVKEAEKGGAGKKAAAS